MQYALLLYMDDATLPELLPEAERAAFAADMAAVMEAMRRAGVFGGSQRLLPSDTATAVRVREGRALVTDGPFAETKESLAGFIVVECADLDAALAWAARVPVARSGTVEVRALRPCG
jgi:hypothetical protein